MFPLAEEWLRYMCTVRLILPSAAEECIADMKRTPIHKKYVIQLSWHRKMPKKNEVVDVFYLEGDAGRGIQALGAALYPPTSTQLEVKQFSLHLKYGCADLKNSEFGASRGWALWALSSFLRTAGYEAVSVTSQDGNETDRPNCFSKGIMKKPLNLTILPL